MLGPNIYGRFNLGLDAGNGIGVNNVYGCFAAVDFTGIYNLAHNGTGRQANQAVELSASRSSSCYKNNSVVRSLSLSLNYVIKY